MTTKIIEAVALLIGYFSAKGLDYLIGKWIAYVTIAFEQFASEKAKKSFNDAIAEIKMGSKEKADAWENWRARVSKT